MALKLVEVESPYAGNTERNERYARMCAKDCIRRGESPFVTHLLYTQPGILDDEIPEERELGMRCGKAWTLKAAELVAVYTDLGITQGMAWGIEQHRQRGTPIVYRELPADLMASVGPEE